MEKQHNVLKKFRVEDSRDSRLPEVDRRSLRFTAGEIVFADVSSAAGVILKKLGTTDEVLVHTITYAALMNEGFISR